MAGVSCLLRPPSGALEAREDEWLSRANFSRNNLQRYGVAHAATCRTPRIRLRTTIEHEGTWDAAEEPAKKMRRKLDNESALGGMRWPTKACASALGWALVVHHVQRELDAVAEEHRVHLRGVLNTLG